MLNFRWWGNFQRALRKKVKEDTWSKDLPMVYVNKDNKIVRHYKDGRIEEIGTVKPKNNLK